MILSCPIEDSETGQECGEDISFTVYKDSEGDPNVINGVNEFWVVEDWCNEGCGHDPSDWDPTLLDKMEDLAIEMYASRDE